MPLTVGVCKLTVEAITFSADYGYTPTARTITITSDENSTGDATITSVALSADTYFTLNTAGASQTVEAGKTNTTYTIQSVSGLSVGSYTATITVSYNGTTTDPATVTFTVNKATPTYETPTLTATYGQTLADVALSDGWAWKDDTQEVGDVGTNTFTAIYTPTDTKNYNTVTVSVSITATLVPTCDLYFVESEGVTFTATDGVTTIEEGETFNFSVEVAEGYDASTLVVEYKRGVDGSWKTLVPALDGDYCLRNVYDDSISEPRSISMAPPQAWRMWKAPRAASGQAITTSAYSRRKQGRCISTTSAESRFA